MTGLQKRDTVEPAFKIKNISTFQENKKNSYITRNYSNRFIQHYKLALH